MPKRENPRFVSKQFHVDYTISLQFHALAKHRKTTQANLLRKLVEAEVAQAWIDGEI